MDYVLSLAKSNHKSAFFFILYQTFLVEIVINLHMGDIVVCSFNIYLLLAACWSPPSSLCLSCLLHGGNNAG